MPICSRKAQHAPDQTDGRFQLPHCHHDLNPLFSQVDHRDGRRQDFASRHAEDGDLGARGIVQIVIRGGETVARGCLVPISDTGIPV